MFNIGFVGPRCNEKIKTLYYCKSLKILIDFLVYVTINSLFSNTFISFSFSFCSSKSEPCYPGI